MPLWHSWFYILEPRGCAGRAGGGLKVPQGAPREPQGIIAPAARGDRGVWGVAWGVLGPFGAIWGVAWDIWAVHSGLILFCPTAVVDQVTADTSPRALRRPQGLPRPPRAPQAPSSALKTPQDLLQGAARVDRRDSKGQPQGGARGAARGGLKVAQEHRTTRGQARGA